MNVTCPRCKKQIILNMKVFFSQKCPTCHCRMDKDNEKVYSYAKLFARLLCVALFSLMVLRKDSISARFAIPDFVVWLMAAILFGILLALTELLFLKLATRLNQYEKK